MCSLSFERAGGTCDSSHAVREIMLEGDTVKVIVAGDSCVGKVRPLVGEGWVGRGGMMRRASHVTL